MVKKLKIKLFTHIFILLMYHHKTEHLQNFLHVLSYYLNDVNISNELDE